MVPGPRPGTRGERPLCTTDTQKGGRAEMTNLTPEQRLAMAAADVLVSLSAANLRSIRDAATDSLSLTGSGSVVRRGRLRDLADALDAARPGFLDAVLAEIEKGTA